LVGCAIAAAAACNSSNRGNVDGNADANGTAHSRTDQAADVNRNEARQTPITVTGCLQQGDGHTYILTRLNEPAQKSVGTSGTPAAVEREQLREAANAYRIDPSGDVKLDDMVGKQIRVSGTLAERADLPKPEASASTNENRDQRATTGSVDDNANKRARANTDRADIKEGDLAKIDATSVSVVNEACGPGAAKRSSGKSNRSKSR
jgi:hypothetical protein